MGALKRLFIKEEDRCDTCDGNGAIHKIIPASAKGGEQHISTPCPTCRGTGKK